MQVVSPLRHPPTNLSLPAHRRTGTMEGAGGGLTAADANVAFFGARLAGALRLSQASWDKFLQSEGARCGPPAPPNPPSGRSAPAP